MLYGAEFVCGCTYNGLPNGILSVQYYEDKFVCAGKYLR